MKPQAIPEGIVWIISESRHLSQQEKQYVYPFTALFVKNSATALTEARHGTLVVGDYGKYIIGIPNPRTIESYFLTYEDARMVLEDDGGDGYCVVPVFLRKPGSAEGKRFSVEDKRFSVGRYVLIDLSGFEFEQEYRGVKGATTWLIDEMKAYDGKVFKIEDMLKEDLALICGYEWLTQWLVPVASPEHDSEGFKVGDRVRINFPKEHLLGGGNGTELGINHFMKKRQGEVATIERVVERVSKVDAFRLKFDERPGCDNSWLWCSTWLQKA